MMLSLCLLSFAETCTRFEVTLSDAETKLGCWLGMLTHPGRDARHLWRLHLGCGFVGLPPEPVIVTRHEDLHTRNTDTQKPEHANALPGGKGLGGQLCRHAGYQVYQEGEGACCGHRRHRYVQL